MKSITIFVTIFISIHNVFCEEILVEVEQGKLSGRKVETITGDMSYYSFKGIPYAKPPVGSLRFKSPQPASPWEGVRNATEHGSICPQRNIYTGIFYPGSEDCLFLNVYTPNITTDSLLPVMFFIHGGGYKCFSGNDDNFGPDFLVDKGVVLVTINYRLDALGFLCLDNEQVPGNAGLRDQLEALKWVNRNINKFGGNPDMITIFGESAGGASVTYHVLSPLSKGYFHRAIDMSGSPYCDWTLPYQPARRAFALGRLFGYEAKNKTDLLNFLQTIPSDDLVNTRPTVLAAEELTHVLTKMIHFPPVYEKASGQEAFIPDEPHKLIDAGIYNDVDFMSGYTDQESILLIPSMEDIFLARANRYPEILVPSKILIKSTPDTVLDISDKIRQRFIGDRSINVTIMRDMVNFLNNATFLYDIHRFIRGLPNNEGKARYFYKFSCLSERNVHNLPGIPYNITGAAHMDDQMYLFDAKSMNMTLEKNSLEYELVQKVTTLFTNFAKYGNPTPDSSLGFIWPQFDNEKLAYAELGNTFSASNAVDEDDVQFWKSILNDAGIDF